MCAQVCSTFYTGIQKQLKEKLKHQAWEFLPASKSTFCPAQPQSSAQLLMSWRVKLLRASRAAHGMTSHLLFITINQYHSIKNLKLHPEKQKRHSEKFSNQRRYKNSVTTWRSQLLLDSLPTFTAWIFILIPEHNELNK